MTALRRLRAWTLPFLLLAAACTPVVIPAGPVVTCSRSPRRRWSCRTAPGCRCGAGCREGAPRAILLALHGFNDAAGNFMEEAAPGFAAASVAVYAYDQRGFGAWPHPGIWAGAASLAADATEAARLVLLLGTPACRW